MFANILHVSTSMRARTVGTNSLGSRRGVVAGFIAEAAWAALVVALFLGWLMSGPASESVKGRRTECVSFGRGGARCDGTAQGPSHPATASGCVSLGKGGLVCFDRPTSTKQ
jgi:hypothetical protein